MTPIDLSTWLFNQAPAIVLLSVIVVVLWRTYQQRLTADDETRTWRASMNQHLLDIDKAIEQQSARIATVEGIVGLLRGKSPSIN